MSVSKDWEAAEPENRAHSGRVFGFGEMERELPSMKTCGVLSCSAGDRLKKRQTHKTHHIGMSVCSGEGLEGGGAGSDRKEPPDRHVFHVGVQIPGWRGGEGDEHVKHIHLGTFYVLSCKREREE